MPVSPIVGEPSVLEASVQPARFIAKPLGLYNSIHSSTACAAVPPHATSLMTTVSGATLVGVFVRLGVGVGVLVRAGVEVSVGVGAGKVVEFACFGVALRGLPFASNPLRFTPLLLCQFESVSGAEALMRSIEY